MGHAKVLHVDSYELNSIIDFYNAIFRILGSPSWHGVSIDSLIDSMVWGGINAEEPPYTIDISGVDQLPDAVRQEIRKLCNALEISKKEYQKATGDQLDVSITLHR